MPLSGSKESSSRWSRTRNIGFSTTHWSVVVRARNGQTPHASAALEALLEAYWYPVYAYVRRCGHSPPDAEDLTQSFFALLLARKDLATVDQAKGRFRNFLLASLENFLANERDKARAQKRGGGLGRIAIQRELAERWYSAEATSRCTPEKLYEQQWACALLDRVVARLAEGYAARGELPLFEALKSTLVGDATGQNYTEIAGRFGCSEASLRMRVQRLRLMYQRILREEITATVADSEYVEDELAYLLSVFGG